MIAASGAWWVVIGLGVFHGINPGMGWLFAVSNGLQARRSGAVWSALLPLGAGHLLAMAAVVLPAALLDVFVVDQAGLRIAAALLLIGFGVYKLIQPRHPRVVGRVGPTRLTLWSFLMASAHGAGLMLLPVFFELAPQNADHLQHAAAMLPDTMALGLLLVALHTLTMVVTAGIIAWLVYRYFGLRLLRQAWINTDRAWAVALIAVGAIALMA